MTINFSGGNSKWLDLKMSPNKDWFSGGYPKNDHEIEVPDPRKIKPHDHLDMSPFGTWQHQIPNFASNATDDDKKGNPGGGEIKESSIVKGFVFNYSLCL